MRFFYKIHNFFCVDAISAGVQEITSEEIIESMRRSSKVVEKVSSPYARLAWYILKNRANNEEDKVSLEGDPKTK